MCRHSYRLVDHNEVCILEEDGDQNMFLLDHLYRREVDVDDITATYSIRLLDRTS
jgi:hypothetical protein